MSAKKKPYQKRPFESTRRSSDTSANIYMSMPRSDTWKSLSPQQRALYLACKAQYYGESDGAKRQMFKSFGMDVPADSIREYFSMNQKKWMDDYGLYKPGNEKGFYRDMGVLVKMGFIDVVASGRNTRTKSIYRYSARWQNHKTENHSAIDINP